MLLVRIVAPELQRADAELPDDIIGNPEKHLASACEVMLGCARVGARARGAVATSWQYRPMTSRSCADPGGGWNPP